MGKEVARVNAFEVLSQADLLSPNQYTTEQKLQWLGELEGRIYADVILAKPEKLEEMEKTWQDTLAVTWPHTDLYVHWLLAKIHQANGELELYQNRMESFNASYQNYVNWYIRNYDPANQEGGVWQ